MRRFRLLMYGVITLFVLGVIGAGLVSLFFDLNSLKPTLAEAAFDATGRKLAIDGDIELSLFPRPRATATGIRLSNTAGGSEPDAITIGVASAQVAWFPLLIGNVDVRQIQVSGDTFDKSRYRHIPVCVMQASEDPCQRGECIWNDSAPLAAMDTVFECADFDGHTHETSQ